MAEGQSGETTRRGILSHLTALGFGVMAGRGGFREIGIGIDKEREPNIIKTPVIIGLVYNDTGDGKFSGLGVDVKPVAGEEVELQKIKPDGSSSRVSTVKTDENGMYLFEGLDIGKYRVGLTRPANATNPSTGGYSVQGQREIGVTSGTRMAFGQAMGVHKS